MDNRLNVLELVGNAITGGMETSILRLVERLPRESFAVTCMVPFEGAFAAALRNAGADVVIAPMPPEDPSWRAIQLACSLVKTRSVDILHAHMSNAHTLAALAGKLCAKPVLATLHTRALAMGDLEIQRLTGTHLCAVCRHTYLHALAVGVNPAQMHLVPNGVDTRRFAPQSEGRALQRELGLPPSTPLIGFVGRLAPEKGPEVFLRAAWLLRRSLPEAHFAVIGTGPLEEVLDEMRRTLQMESYVHLCGLRNDLPSVYASLDLLMLTSYSEAMPLVLLEAMACGVPVVATAVGGVPELVEHGATGYLARENDYEGLAAFAHTLLTRGHERAAFSRRARERAVEDFDIDESAGATAELLVRLAGRTERTADRRVGTLSSLPKPAPIPGPGATKS
jgi:glycosyltransferase involved in cell wall biosynthesis